jgi:hypothetical protein
MISGRTPPLTAIAKVFNVLGLVYVTRWPEPAESCARS